MGGACGTLGIEFRCMRVFGGKTGGSPCRWLYCNIKINLKELGWEGVDWIQLAQGIGK